MKLFRFKKKEEESPTVGEVVIIDDTPENLHLLNDLLSDRGYKVRALPNGQMGLSSCQASPPDLVLLDITMPGMNGYEVAEKLKADSRTRDVPIIFISAMNQTEDKVTAFEAGGVDYITKPLQVDEVIARVKTHISISRMREQINQANEQLLTWNVTLAQAGGRTETNITERLAEAFEKSRSELAEGDKAEAQVSLIAASSASSDTLDEFAVSLREDAHGAVITRFGGILVGVSPDSEVQVADWISQSFEKADIAVSIREAEGILQVTDQASIDGGLRLDFLSEETLKVIADLVDS